MEKYIYITVKTKDNGDMINYGKADEFYDVLYNQINYIQHYSNNIDHYSKHAKKLTNKNDLKQVIKKMACTTQKIKTMIDITLNILKNDPDETNTGYMISGKCKSCLAYLKNHNEHILNMFNK